MLVRYYFFINKIVVFSF